MLYGLTAKTRFFYQHPDTHEKNDSLEGGIAAATGISFGAIYNIPRMLMPNISGWSLTDLRDPMLVGVEMFEAEPCYRISGTGHDGDPTEIWISSLLPGSNSLLMRVVSSY